MAIYDDFSVNFPYFRFQGLTLYESILSDVGVFMREGGSRTCGFRLDSSGLLINLMFLNWYVNK